MITTLLLAVGLLQGATITVPAGGDFQAALNKALPGDTIVLEAGAVYTGHFVLPPIAPVSRQAAATRGLAVTTTAAAPITIRSSATLPERRITPQDAALMPTIAPPTVEPAIACANGAGWILRGLQIQSHALGMYDLIRLQDCDAITLDQILIIGGANGQKRGILGNGTNITLTRSHIANVWRPDQDSQAFCAWDGAGPYRVIDNYLEAAGENVMFGGANSQSAARVPADILVEQNTFFKPLSWKGQPRSVKNLFELKSAKRVTVRNNTFENNWTSSQNGFAILFTVRNDEGGAPWSVVEDVLFERNVITNVENGFNIHGYDSYQPSGRGTRITIRHNLLRTFGVAFQLGGELGTTVIDHNTIENGWTFMMLYKGDIWVASEQTIGSRSTRFAVEDLTVTNTLAYHKEYGVFGEEAGIGTPALAADMDPHLDGIQPHVPKYQWTNNALAGVYSYPYPPVTLKPTEETHRAQFNADYSLTASSTYRNAGTEGSNMGATITGGGGGPTPTPTPPVTQPITVTTTATQCEFTLTQNPPDDRGGWRVQFRYNGVNFGNADSQAPYTRSKKLPTGEYKFTADWTKDGAEPVQTSAPGACRAVAQIGDLQRAPQ